MWGRSAGHTEGHATSDVSSSDPTALDVVSRLVAAMAERDIETMQSLHAEDYVVDWVYGDAFENPPVAAQESAAFFPAWFVAFEDIDYDVQRTIAGEAVVVTEWVFTGTHTGRLGPPVFEEHLEPTGRTIQFRGATIYDVTGGLIQRETVYMDLATLLVELGARL